MDKWPWGAEQPSVPALLRARVDTASLSLVIGLLVETGKAVGSKLHLHLLLGFFFCLKIYPFGTDVFAEADDRERAVRVARLQPSFNYSFAPENDVFFICR